MCWNLLNIAIDFVVLIVNNFPILQTGSFIDFTGSHYLLLHVKSY